MSAIFIISIILIPISLFMFFWWVWTANEIRKNTEETKTALREIIRRLEAKKGEDDDDDNI